MKFADTLLVKRSLSGGYDDDGNPIVSQSEWVNFGKEKNCIILPNDKASKVRLNDGSEYVYSYVVLIKLRKDLVSIIPVEGDKVHIKKYDGTIDRDMEVKGFVTLKSKYLKIWL